MCVVSYQVSSRISLAPSSLGCDPNSKALDRLRMNQGAIMKTQEDPGAPRSQEEQSEEPGRARRSEEEPAGARRSRELLGGPKSPEVRGAPSRTQEPQGFFQAPGRTQENQRKQKPQRQCLNLGLVVRTELRQYSSRSDAYHSVISRHVMLCSTHLKHFDNRSFSKN